MESNLKAWTIQGARLVRIADVEKFKAKTVNKTSGEPQRSNPETP
jgi:DNA-binding CsgD family transcriptional regulator